METARDKLRIDLFDRRRSAYDQLRMPVARVKSQGRVKAIDVDDFKTAKLNARFLFDEDMESYLDRVHDALIEAETLNSELKDEPVGETRTKIVREHRRQRDIIDTFYPEMTQRLEQYLRLPHS